MEWQACYGLNYYNVCLNPDGHTVYYYNSMMYAFIPDDQVFHFLTTKTITLKLTLGEL